MLSSGPSVFQQVGRRTPREEKRFQGQGRPVESNWGACETVREMERWREREESRPTTAREADVLTNTVAARDISSPELRGNQNDAGVSTRVPSRPPPSPWDLSAPEQGKRRRAWAGRGEGEQRRAVKHLQFSLFRARERTRGSSLPGGLTSDGPTASSMLLAPPPPSPRRAGACVYAVPQHIIYIRQASGGKEKKSRG